MTVGTRVRMATLIVNPVARRAHRLVTCMPAVRALLAEHGYAVEVFETTNADSSARELAAHAARSSSLVLACGGDGTVHGVVQGLAHSGVALGVVPLGTANALARNLGLPLDPLAAAERLMTYQSFTIPLGEMETAQGRRFFAVMAGCGPDGALVNLLSHTGSSRWKKRLGRHAYYAHAARLFLTRRWPSFHIEYRKPQSDAWESVPAVALMVSRVSDLGGLFTGMTREASLTYPHLQVHLLRAPAQLSMPAWLLCSRSGLRNPWLTKVEVDELRCTPTEARAVYAQADAEPLGTLPFSLSIVPAALRLLMPPTGDSPSV